MCRELDDLDIIPTPVVKFISHSIRIGDYTEPVLLGVPHEVRLELFGWKHKSGNMAALYYDRIIRTTAASYSVFGDWRGELRTCGWMVGFTSLFYGRFRLEYNWGVDTSDFGFLLDGGCINTRHGELT